MMQVLVYKHTLDDWHPNYILKDDTQLVRVQFAPSEPDGSWVVAVGGQDDMSIEGVYDSESIAWSKFLLIIGLEYVTVEDVLSILGEQS